MNRGTQTAIRAKSQFGIPILVHEMVWQYIGINFETGSGSEPRTKNAVLTIRTSAEVKDLLKLAAEQEEGSAASMVEILIIEYTERCGLVPRVGDFGEEKKVTHNK